jgi:hypothetical protein
MLIFRRFHPGKASKRFFLKKEAKTFANRRTRCGDATPFRE